MSYSFKKVRNLLDKHNFAFKKKYGQNFIIDENIINNIINKSDIDSETLVIEIGPGAGALTVKLAQKAKNVLCYEVDNTLSDILNEILIDETNVEVKYQDFLKGNIKQDISKYNYKKIYVVANLPYYITTPILNKIIEDNLPVDKIVVMVQKEVGDRFRALPGSKEYGSLTVFLNYHYYIKKIMDVSKSVFIPQPKVDSVIIEFIKKEEINLVTNKKLFFKLVRDSFKQKRKTLKNNLKGYDLEKIGKILKKYQLDLQVRAEQLPLEIFIEIANSL